MTTIRARLETKKHSLGFDTVRVRNEATNLRTRKHQQTSPTKKTTFCCNTLVSICLSLPFFSSTPQARDNRDIREMECDRETGRPKLPTPPPGELRTGNETQNPPTHSPRAVLEWQQRQSAREENADRISRRWIFTFFGKSGDRGTPTLPEKPRALPVGQSVAGIRISTCSFGVSIST